MTTDEFTVPIPPAPRAPLHLADHRPSHLEVVGRVPRYSKGAEQAELSAVVVSTSRPLAQSRIGLELAAVCAASRGARFVVIRSGAATRDPFGPQLVARTALPTVVIDLPDGLPLPLPAFENARHQVATRYRRNDLSRKRNLALAIGLVAGWETVLFLDDDITTRRASQLPRLPEHLPAELAMRLDDVFAEFHHNRDLMAAGYLQKDFDDHSVVCHIRKYAGLPQDEFISGGAIVVRCTPGIPFFPDCYNEDWLFLFFLMMQGIHRSPASGVKRIGSIHQAAYYPFAAPRAQSEEFGDVFAEGLYNLLDLTADDIAREASSLSYWKEVVHARQSMITKLLAHFQDKYGPTDHAVINDVQTALRAALVVYPSTLARSAELMASYFETLMADLPRWYEYTANLTDRYGPLPLDRAMAELKLSDHATELHSRGPQWLPRARQTAAS